jgi:hypothetical protein
MATYIDKKHRVKKTDRGYIPQWKAGWFRWKPYEYWYADTVMGPMSIYSPLYRDPVFETEETAIEFLQKAMKAGDNGKYHQDFDECMPGLIRY